MTHICVSKLTIIGSDNGLSSSRCQAIIWTNAGILLKRTSGTNFSEILSEMHAFSLKKMHLKMSSTKWRPFCLGLNGLKKLKTNEWPFWVLFSRCSRALWTNESINYIFVKYINAVWQYQIPPPPPPPPKSRKTLVDVEEWPYTTCFSHLMYLKFDHDQRIISIIFCGM